VKLPSIFIADNQASYSNDVGFISEKTEILRKAFMGDENLWPKRPHKRTLIHSVPDLHV
jgi:hypothetical protein